MCREQDAWVAQSVEQGTENPRVGGSIPPPGTPTKLEHLGLSDRKVCRALTFRRRARAPWPWRDPSLVA